LGADRSAPSPGEAAQRRNRNVTILLGVVLVCILIVVWQVNRDQNAADNQHIKQQLECFKYTTGELTGPRPPYCDE
jgi:hypothetical protein